jgi:hypothetical protein
MRNNKNNILIKDEQKRILIAILIILLLVLLFRKLFTAIVERIIVLMIIFILFLLITKNITITIIGTISVFLLINLIISYRNTVESFEDVKIDPKSISDEPLFDKNIFESDDFKKSSDGIQDLIKKMNGGVELKEDDTTETNPLNIDLQKYSDDKKPNALKDAQKETYELINTVNALKDTISTLAPVLQEGKKLMNIFENLKL